jgi:hypothetical protein
MNEKLGAIVKKIRELEEEFEEEITRVGKDIKYRIEGRKILFERSVMEYHRSLRTSIYRYLRITNVKNLILSAGIYIMFFPVAVIDLLVFLFQSIVFPRLGLEKVSRSEFIVFDRHKLQYLNFFQKVGCVYCSYVNGVAAYYSEVAGAAESYYCPIKHARRIRKPHAYYHEFVPYGHAEEYRERINELRKEK